MNRNGVRSSLIGISLTIAIWWLAAETVFAGVGVRPDGSGGAIPNPLQVVTQMAEDGFEFYFRNGSMTIIEASIGFLWGNVLALGFAAVALLVPRLENLSTQIAVITYCIPIVAIGPIVRLVVGAPGPGEPAGAAIVLAALSVFFTTMVGTLTGVKATDKKMLDVVSAYGGGSWQRLIKIQLISALPSIFASLKIAAPAAFLGAILGEYVGGPDVGFGPAMVNAQQSLEIARVWGVALVSGLLAGAGYALFGLLGKTFTPWAMVSLR
ncbi:ABC transporter permease [Candidatus Aquiluna sp. UB-MaderosW2red]|uniref:ABC transporter permease n=1 Tax=Candidatus Aquiluna sp. UB-MaderosW2red TaxID=1855377 RepID=UPI000875A97E|nr:ABC transporter permease subunit [Candidatus Aquiluna sp. UB-MaderosW2red]SCX10073.1 ABC-type nitrate/sulfonate/bicarbonate transport system, permease component [Candidatus Aquiluna sp. UB-MaderosW2red]